MVHRVSSSGRDRTAIGLSIVAHCCAFAVLALLPQTIVVTQASDEAALVASSIRIEHRPRLAVASARALEPRRTQTRTVLAPQVTVVPQHASTAKTAVEEQQVVVAHVRLRRALPPALVAAVQPPGRSSERTVHVASAQPALADPHPAPAATAAPVAAVAAEQHDDGIGNFGEDYPAKVDPQSRPSLFSGVAGSFLIRISLDESGRPTAIDFIHGPSDPALQAELRTRLLAAHFIPQICNGLRCAGTLELRN